MNGSFGAYGRYGANPLFEGKVAAGAAGTAAEGQALKYAAGGGKGGFDMSSLPPLDQVIAEAQAAASQGGGGTGVSTATGYAPSSEGGGMMTLMIGVAIVGALGIGGVFLLSRKKRKKNGRRRRFRVKRYDRKKRVRGHLRRKPGKMRRRRRRK